MERLLRQEGSYPMTVPRTNCQAVGALLCVLNIVLNPKEVAHDRAQEEWQVPGGTGAHEGASPRLGSVSDTGVSQAGSFHS